MSMTMATCKEDPTQSTTAAGVVAGSMATEVYGKLREAEQSLRECSINPLIQAGGICEADDYTFGDLLQLTSDFYGSGSQVKISRDNEKTGAVSEAYR